MFIFQVYQKPKGMNEMVNAMKGGFVKAENRRINPRPWTMQELIDIGRLSLGVDSTTPNTQTNAVKTIAEFEKKISELESKYKKLIKDKGNKDPEVLERANDLSIANQARLYFYLMQNRYLRYNKSIKGREKAIDDYYKAEIASPGMWDRLRKALPFIDGLLVAGGVYVAAQWLTNMWNGITDAVKSLFDPQYQPIAVGATNITGISLLAGLSTWIQKRINRKKFKLEDENVRKQGLLMNLGDHFERAISLLVRNRVSHIISKSDDFSELEKEDPTRFKFASDGKWEALNQIYGMAARDALENYKKNVEGLLQKISPIARFWEKIRKKPADVVKADVEVEAGFVPKGKP